MTTPFKIAVKLFITGSTPPLHAFIPVFHQWIRDKAIPDHLLIDVADYAHVADGPGVVLVSSEANLYIDQNGGRPGLMYVRKIPGSGDFAAQLQTAVAATFYAANRLERDLALHGQVRFDPSELVIKLNDRLLTPNNAETLIDTKPAFDALASAVYGSASFEARTIGSPRDLFTISIKSTGNASLADLATKLKSPVGNA